MLGGNINIECLFEERGWQPVIEKGKREFGEHEVGKKKENI